MDGRQEGLAIAGAAHQVSVGRIAELDPDEAIPYRRQARIGEQAGNRLWQLLLQDIPARVRSRYRWLGIHGWLDEPLTCRLFAGRPRRDGHRDRLDHGRE